MSTTEERLALLESRFERLEDRLARLEGPTARVPQTTIVRPQPLPPAPRAPRPPAAPPEPRRELDLEELLGGRLLALAGGIAVIVGLAFLVALAVERGWLGEGTRTLLAFAGSAALLALGAWLHEQRDRTQASLAACGTGLAGLFLSLTAATVLYDLVPIELALAGAFAFGALGAALAVRWDATPIGGLGILGALAAPLLTGAVDDAASLLFLAAAEAAAVAVLTWRRWNWLRVAAVTLVLAQVAGWVVSADPSTTRGYVVLALFGVLDLLAGTVYELRRGRGAALASAVIVIGNAAMLALLGAVVAFDQEREGLSHVAAGWWLAGIGLAHVLAGLALLRLQPRNRVISTCLFGVGLVALNVAFVLLVSGVAIPIGWAAAAAALAVPARSLTRSPRLVYAVVGAQIVLAAGHVLLFDAPLDAVSHGHPAGLWPILAIAASAFLVARITPAEEVEWRAATDATALAAVAYGTTVLLNGPALAGAWAAEAALLAEAGRRFSHRVSAAGVFGLLLLAALHALAFEARPDALVEGADPFWHALAALGAVALASAFAAARTIDLFPHDRLVLWLGSGVAVVYLASIGIVSAFQPGKVELFAGNLTVREQGQALLSAFWSVLGVGLLWAGLRRNLRPLRLAGFSLLAVAVGKVFLYDMAALDQGYRVLSFVVLGLLLLAGAYAYQRMRRNGPRLT
jgi:uncharacterized membrane protein